MKNSKSSKYLNMGAETSLSVGIFSASASGEHKEDESHRDSETNVTGIQMDVAAVRIERSWMNETLFALDGWKIAGQKKGHISDGTFVTEEGKKHNEGIMPLIPKYMLVARNVTLTGNFSKALLNEIIIKALRSGDILSDNVGICLVEQELPIDVRRFQNPVTDEGDIRMQSIDSSERIADLINSFGTVSDIEECYMVILEGIQEAFYARSMAGRSAPCVANADDSIMEA